MPPLYAILTAALACLVITNCATTATNLETGYPQQYLAALETNSGTASFDPREVGKRFQALFNDLEDDEELSRKVAGVYAESLFFNDTLETIRDRETLTDYLRETGRKAESLDVEILSAIRDGNDCYLRWRMDMRFTALGKTIETRTVGLSHLRLNNKGLIVLHQDFWDGSEGIYRHLPAIGGLLPRAD